MKKNFYCVVILSTLLFQKASAQQTCDTINSPVSPSWSDTSYKYTDPFGTPLGYINGTNSDGPLQKANYFDLSGSSYGYILGALVKFGKANSTLPANLSKLIYFRVYSADPNKGIPLTLLTTAQKTLAEVKADVDAGRNTVVVFPSATSLPSDKKFFVSVDITNFIWDIHGDKDSIWIGGTADDQVEPNAAWDADSVGTKVKWTPFSNNYVNPADQSNALDVTLWIFPHVGTTASGCTLLPVSILSFTAQKNNKDVQLEWEISDEINMKGYEVQKSLNNSSFETVGFVKALNSLKNQSYNYTDRNAFATSTNVQYRLKQVDGDGSIKYSRVIALKSDASFPDVLFANPFSGALKLQLNLSESKQVAVNVFDMQGRLVATMQLATYGTASNTIIIPSTSNLKPGAYLLQINSGKEQNVYKIIKQ